MIKGYNPNDPNLQSWVMVPTGSDFPIQNLPLGVAYFDKESEEPSICTRIGDYLVPLSVLCEVGCFESMDEEYLIDEYDFMDSELNGLLIHGRGFLTKLRTAISYALSAKDPFGLKEYKGFLKKAQKVKMDIPVTVGDYTDFYSSREHATNVGMMFRDPANALLPNWLHMPIGYHGRASSILPSGKKIRRPNGQMMPKGAETPVFGPSQRLDFELEMAFVTCSQTKLGKPIQADNAEDYIAGMVLFNDWSARDIQQWEYVPLGPFLGKNFASSMSPWLVLMDALEPFRVAGPEQSPTPLPYLQSTGNANFDINLEVSITPKDQAETIVSRTNFKHMYWNMRQQLAHHTVNGCNIRTGDVCASGTISGPTPDSYGSMLEIAWNGTKPVTLADGTTRTFLHDHDTVKMRGWCEANGVRIGFGELRGTIFPNEV